jgi:tetratricopeptide (TPR) repeat protein
LTYIDYENGVAAVKQYRFKPAMEDGKPVAVALNVLVNFQIFKDKAEADQASAGPVAVDGAPPPPAVPGCPFGQSGPSDADLALRQRRYADAERLYGDALTAEPASSAAMAGLVRAMLGEGKLPEALALAMKDDSAHPNDALLLDALGEVRFRRGEVDEAAMDFNRSAHLNQCSGETQYDMYRFLNLSGMYASAQRRLDLAHALAPANPEITARWRASHAAPQTPEQMLAALNKALENPSLTEEQKARFATEIKTIEALQRGSCEMTTPVTEVKLPMASISSVANPDVMYEAGLEVQINGKKRRLEIDTGASGLVLTSAAAKAAGLAPEVEIKLSGIGDKGAASSFISHVDDIKVGSMEFKNCRVRVLEPGNELEKTPDIDGLIGTDVFRDYVVTLDTPSREVRIRPLPARPDEPTAKTPSLATTSDQQMPASLAASARDRYVAPEMKDWTPVFRSAHFLIFPTAIGNAPVKLFIMDSGSSHSLISLTAAREVAQLSGIGAPVIKGLSGEVQKVQVADKVTLGFAGLRQVVNEMTSIDTSAISKSVGVDISGFIGFPTLRELVISIDYRDNLVHAVYDAKKGYHSVGVQ